MLTSRALEVIDLSDRVVLWRRELALAVTYHNWSTYIYIYQRGLYVGSSDSEKQKLSIVSRYKVNHVGRLRSISFLRLAYLQHYTTHIYTSVVTVVCHWFLCLLCSYWSCSLYCQQPSLSHLLQAACTAIIYARPGSRHEINLLEIHIHIYAASA